MKVAVTSVLVLAGLVLAPAGFHSASGATIPLNLHGTAAGGWGYTFSAITSPGPRITVTQGDTVTISLFSDDTLGHQFWLDTNNDSTVQGSEPLSAAFTGSTSITVTPSQMPAAGATSKYYCTIHPGTMYGYWTVQAPPPPGTPAVSIDSPVAGSRWTGGSTQDVRWSVNGLSGGAYRFWVNSTVATTANTLAFGTTTQSSNSTTWTAPRADTSTAIITVTAISGSNSDTKTVTFAIDSTAPTVTSTSLWVASDGRLALSVLWSEAMKQKTDPSDAGLKDSSGKWITTQSVWSGAGTNLTLFVPSPSAGRYTLVINTSETDISDPGNRLAAVYTAELQYNPPATFPVAPVVGGSVVAAVVLLAVLLFLWRRKRP